MNSKQRRASMRDLAQFMRIFFHVYDICLQGDL